METCFINPHELGEERAFCMYYGGTEVFSDKEVEKIKKAGDELSAEKAKTFGQGEEDKNRQGNVGWLPRHNEENEWLYSALLDITKQANEALKKLKAVK